MRVYILVRKDLKYSSPAVQGGHALAELCFVHPKATEQWTKDHKTLVYLGVSDQMELMKYYKEAPLEVKSVYHELDLNNEPTAIAFLASGKLDFFKKLKLL